MRGLPNVDWLFVFASAVQPDTVTQAAAETLVTRDTRLGRTPRGPLNGLAWGLAQTVHP